jgi:hypothetical protein
LQSHQGGSISGVRVEPGYCRQILERYLVSLEDQEAKTNTSNAMLRFFVPGCGGPIPLHKPALPYEVEAGWHYLETVPLEYLNEALASATAVLEALKLAPTQATRIRNALRSLLAWAREEQYLPEPKLVAPWGGEYLSQVVNPEQGKQERLSAFECYQSYHEHLKQSGKLQESNALQTAVVRYLVPASGGPVPTHLRATAQEVQSGLDYLKQIALAQLSQTINAVDVEFDRLELSLEKRRPIRSRLRGWLNWYLAPNVNEVDQELQPIFNTYHTNGVQRQQAKPGAELHEHRCPTHALGAKKFPKDYINAGLQTQLEDYETWRLSKKVTPGSLKSEKVQILQLLGWLHRYEKVPLDTLSFEHMIAKSQLIFKAVDYTEYHTYLMQKEIGIQKARDQADEDKLRVERYLKFTGENSNSKARYLSISIAIAKFLYRDLLDSDDFPDDRNIPILRRLLDMQKEEKKEGKGTPQTVRYQDTSVPWDEAVWVMEQARIRAEQVILYQKERSRRGYKLQQRPETATANELQRFISIALNIFIPSRARTFYDLRIGETFKEGILPKTGFLSVQDLQLRRIWEQCKDSVKFYIHHKKEDFKVGKAMTPALLNSDGWWVEIPNHPFGNTRFYDYIRRWLDWGRAAEGPVNHNFFFRQAFTPTAMDGGGWNDRIKNIFEYWTGVPVPPKNIRQMFTSQFPEYKESGALLLQHSEEMHTTHYDMRQTVEKMKPVMEANARYITEVLEHRSSKPPE